VPDDIVATEQQGVDVRVRVDQGLCIGSGSCVEVVPAVFDQNEDDGIVVLLQPEPPEELHAAVRQAAQICAAHAIFVEE